MVVVSAPGVRPTGPAVFTWDGTRYVRAGRPVPAETVHQGVETVIQASGQRMRALGARLVAGQSSLAEWQQAMAAEMRALHVATATAAHGGTAQMSPADYGWVGQRVRDQYGYLRDFAQQLASGRQPLGGTVASRAALYAEAARGSFEDMGARDQRRGGATQERWLRRASESCGGCVDRAGQGWADIGTLPGWGSMPCRSRCKCAREYR